MGEYLRKQNSQDQMEWHEKGTRCKKLREEIPNTEEYIRKQNSHDQMELCNRDTPCEQLQQLIPKTEGSNHNSLDACYLLAQIFLLDFLYDNFKKFLVEILPVYR